MKISNFHTHTKLCKHAEGLPSDYVRKAMEEGTSELGFSDHCPYPVSLGPVWDNCRMSVKDLDFYVSEVRKAQSLCDFKVHLGFECEYDRNFFSWYKDELKGHYGAEYLVFGPHWYTEGKEHPYIPEINRDAKALYKYTDQVIEGLGSGLYSILAHPDLFMNGWLRWDSETEACLKSILEAAVSFDIPLEINGLGINRGLHETNVGLRYGYPFLEFWEMVSKTSCKVICDSDAHLPEHVIQNARKARSFASELGIVPIETIF